MATQPPSRDTTKRSWSKACCSEANGPMTESELKSQWEKKTKQNKNNANQQQKQPQRTYQKVNRAIERAVTNADTTECG